MDWRQHPHKQHENAGISANTRSMMPGIKSLIERKRLHLQGRWVHSHTKLLVKEEAIAVQAASIRYPRWTRQIAGCIQVTKEITVVITRLTSSSFGMGSPRTRKNFIFVLLTYLRRMKASIFCWVMKFTPEIKSWSSIYGWFRLVLVGQVGWAKRSLQEQELTTETLINAELDNLDGAACRSLQEPTHKLCSFLSGTAFLNMSHGFHLALSSLQATWFEEKSDISR